MPTLLAILQVIAIGVTSVTPLTEQPLPDERRCTYQRRSYCDAGLGCKDLPRGGPAFLLLPAQTTLQQADGDHSTIRRCDEKGCTPVVVAVSEGGAFISMSAGSYLLKLATMDVELMGFAKGDFIEVALTGLGAFVSHGTCAGR